MDRLLLVAWAASVGGKGSAVCTSSASEIGV